MNLPLKIAFRYIFSIKSLHFITIISLISMVGIIVGVSAIIAVMSIFNGFRDFTQSKLVAFDPHIRIVPQKGAELKNSDSLKRLIISKVKVKAITSSISGRIIGNYGSNLQVMNAIGIRYQDYYNVNHIENSIILGSFKLKDSDDEIPSVIMGSGLSEKMRILPNDTFTIFSPQILQQSIKTLNTDAGIKVKVTGIFQSYTKDYDDNNCYIDSKSAAQLFNLGDNSSYSIDIRLNDIENSFEVQKTLTSILGQNYQVLTWYDLHKELLNVMKLERIGTFIVLSLIILIAAFNILASLTMTVIEKKRDMSILLSIGSDRNLIKKIYLYQGLIIGLISSTLGTVIGLLFCYGQINYKWFKMDTSKYLIDAIPIVINWNDIIITFFMTLILSVLASYYPAKQAIKISVTDSIRFE